MVSRRRIMIAAALVPALAAGRAFPAPRDNAPAPLAWRADRLSELETFASQKGATGLLIIEKRRTILERNWRPGAEARDFTANFVHGVAPDGSLLEDVASQQKSFLATLLYAARDRGLLDVSRPVSVYAGPGWSRADASAEDRIRVIHLMEMTSGLSEQLTVEAEPGATFFYNTPAYAILKKVIEGAAGRDLATVTSEWLTGPAGMTQSSWRRRPGAFSDVGNPTGLVTTPRDIARFGQVILDRGRAEDGKVILSESSIADMLTPSAANPAYAKLWWRNDSQWCVRAGGRRFETNLIPEAPRDLIAALGAQDRKLFLWPGHGLIVVRTGQSAGAGFDGEFWRILAQCYSA